MKKEYRFSKVSEESYKFNAKCLDCEKDIPAGELKYADLNGKAFNAYYHEKCARSINGFHPLGDEAVVMAQD